MKLSEAEQTEVVADRLLRRLHSVLLIGEAQFGKENADAGASINQLTGAVRFWYAPKGSKHVTYVAEE